MKQEIGRNRSGLRLGYTTGSCAAAAAKAAVAMLLKEEEITHVKLITPKGIELYLEVESTIRTADYVQCAVVKYSGDDPDVTDGMKVYAKAEKIESFLKEEEAEERCFEIKDHIVLAGGEGIGRVTKAGLEQQTGFPAINKIPRRMIADAVDEECRQYKYGGKIKITLSIPGGEKIAKKTFNPRLGIVGGLSVLGTTGIVEPMSEKALTDTIWLEMKMLKETGYDRCYVVPGNYGMDFLREELGVDEEVTVKCSNYIGDTIDDAKLLGMKGILFIGHIGKFVKLAAGVMNTHSRQADCRMEVLAVHAALEGADSHTVRSVMDCVNTSEALRVLKECGLLEKVMESVMERIEFYLTNRAGEALDIAAVVFSNEEGVLGKTSKADSLFEQTSRFVRQKKGR